ncbi:hypothetical protein LA03_31585 [Burkholderia gladioli]|nr:hypothetical protein LA03_31585 [Burkholderia gladioli]
MWDPVTRRLQGYIDGWHAGGLAYSQDLDYYATNNNLNEVNNAVATKFFSPDRRIAPAWSVGNGFVAITIDGAGYGIVFAPSDERMKENIKPSTVDSLQVVSEIQLFGFKYKDGFILTGQRDLGFSAQQLHSIKPEFVVGEPDGEMMMSPNLEPIVAHLVGAVQQLGAELKQLRAGA